MVTNWSDAMFLEGEHLAEVVRMQYDLNSYLILTRDEILSTSKVLLVPDGVVAMHDFASTGHRP